MKDLTPCVCHACDPMRVCVCDPMRVGYIYAQSGIYDETFRDNPSKVRDIQIVGTLNISLGDVSNMMREFASVTNQNHVPYMGLQFNSNSYAFTFIESLGFTRPTPFGVWAPGWNNGTFSGALSYVNKKK
jgi:hypothetical protein